MSTRIRCDVRVEGVVQGVGFRSFVYALATRSAWPDGWATILAVIAARFHNGVTDVIERCCRLLRDSTGISTVALSGGVFQNLLLLTRVADRLSTNEFVYSHIPGSDQ